MFRMTVRTVRRLAVTAATGGLALTAALTAAPAQAATSSYTLLILPDQGKAPSITS